MRIYAIHWRSDIPIHFGMAARQKIFAKNADFATLIGCHGNVLSARDRQMYVGFIKPLHSSTNVEILVKIHLVVHEIDLLRGRPLKIKKTSAKYINK